MKTTVNNAFIEWKEFTNKCGKSQVTYLKTKNKLLSFHSCISGLLCTLVV